MQLWRNRLGVLLGAAVVIALVLAIAAVLRPDILQPAPPTLPAPLEGAGALHLTADELSDHPHDPLHLIYLLADGSTAAASDTVPAETTVFVDRSLPAGPVRVVANGRECSGTLAIEPGRETDAVISDLYEAVCRITTAGSHLPGTVIHPEPRTALGAFVVVETVLVVRPLDPGSTTGVVRKPADERAEVKDFDIPPGRYELALEVDGTVLKALEVELQRGQEFWFNVRALDPAVPLDCGEVPAPSCRAAAEAAYAQPQGAGMPATRHVVAVRVRPSRYTGGCQPFDPPRYDVSFDVREESRTIEITLGGRPDGRFYYCTY